MSKYHFVREDERERLGENGLPLHRVSSEYGNMSYEIFGKFVRADLYDFGDRVLTVANCEGSLMAIRHDHTQNPINKIHIGELKIRRPHAESSLLKGDAGPRIDLSQFDIDFALRELDELKKWRSPEYRRKLDREYEEYGWYCVKYRSKQLNISPEGLEEKIAEMEQHIAILHQDPDRRYVSETTKKIEKNSYAMVALMKTIGKQQQQILHDGGRQLTKNERMSPKILANNDIIYLAHLVDLDLFNLLKFIRSRADLKRAFNYWQRVAAWGDM